MRLIMKTYIKGLILCFIVFLMAASAYAQQKATANLFNHDIGVSGIKLQSANSTTVVLGKNAWNGKFEKEDGFGMPRIEVINADKTQLLRLGFFEGDFENNVQAFQIQYLPANYKLSAKTAKINTPAFISALNIKLGMTKADLIKRIGNSYKASKDKGSAKLKWYTNDPNSSFLKEYKAVGYTIECKFDTNGKLSQYYFGFEYP
jgi:hypothetical protein